MTPAVMSTVQPLIIVKIGNLKHCKFQTDLCIFEVDQKKTIILVKERNFFRIIITKAQSYQIEAISINFAAEKCVWF